MAKGNDATAYALKALGGVVTFKDEVARRAFDEAVGAIGDPDAHGQDETTDDEGAKTATKAAAR